METRLNEGFTWDIGIISIELNNKMTETNTQVTTGEEKLNNSVENLNSQLQSTNEKITVETQKINNQIEEETALINAKIDSNVTNTTQVTTDLL